MQDDKIKKMDISKTQPASNEDRSKEKMQEKLRKMEQENAPLIQRVNESNRYIELLIKEVKIRWFMKWLLLPFPLAAIKNKKRIFQAETEIMSKQTFVVNLLKMIGDNNHAKGNV